MTDELDTRTQWRWLANSYWYVLPPDLPALELNPDEGALGWLVDQTIWHISDYANGYFWGVTAALMYDAGEPVPQRGLRSRISQLTMLGTVVSSGRVQITFSSNARSSNAVLGFGQMAKVGSGWTFEMQMSTERGSNRVLHWANMAQTREGDPSWQQLPGVPYSVPEMLEGAVYPRPPSNR